MNPKSIFKLFNPKGKVQATVYQVISALMISSVMLSLMALTGSVQKAQASGPEAGGQPSIEMLRSVDPADRKFFSPGYGVMTGVPKDTTVLPATDPADRKFFSPGYGALAAISVETEVLPTIDPADRKFFSADYGTQTFGVDKYEAVLSPSN